jgi:transcriptional regulator NrdR family protein
MHKHKLIELRKIIEERIGSLTEEVEIATNVKLNPLYIADRKDEIEFLQWIVRIIQPILNRDNDERQQLATIKKRLEMMETIEFENIVKERVEELNLNLKDCNNLRESDVLINEIDTLESVLGRLSDLKYGDKVRAIEIAEADKNFQQANRLRKQLIKIQDTEDEISAQIQN